MVVNCEEVWREVSNYLDGEVEPTLRTAIEDHIRGCTRCAAVLDGTRNVIQLYGDDRMLEVPLGYSQRLHRRLDENMPSNRRSFLGWMVAAAAVSVWRGSSTRMSGLCGLFIARCQRMGWAMHGLLPMNTMTSDCSRSAYVYGGASKPKHSL